MECKKQKRKVAKEILKYNLDLVGLQEARWDRCGTNPAGKYKIFYGKQKWNHELHTGYFMPKRIISAVKRAEFVSDRMLYIILRGRWCDITVLNAHAPTEDKSGDMKASFCEKLEHVFDKFC